MESEMEVLQITRSYDIETGDTVYEVSFGKTFEVNERIRSRIKSPDSGEPPEVLSVNIVTLVIPSSAPVPYMVGTKWSLKINEDGSLSVTPKGQGKK
jgi:hypothetical protein